MKDEFVCDTLAVQKFIGNVQQIIETTDIISERLTMIRPFFSQLMADATWLPEQYRQTVDDGGMGKGIANWLLYRDQDGSLSFSALVLSPGAATPVHDHLAWGLVGLYVGEQDEEVYESDKPVGLHDHKTTLRIVANNHLKAGSFYELIPPNGDIHRVVTTGAVPSISLHLLGNDVGCVLRHRFDADSGAIAPFRSGYTNQVCEDDHQ